MRPIQTSQGLCELESRTNALACDFGAILEGETVSVSV
jgi:hypothetical protein